MIAGIFCGFTAALLNAFGYFFNARFIRYYHSPGRLLVASHLVMFFVMLPVLLVIIPWLHVPDWGRFALLLAGWTAVFFLGQICFFLAISRIEPSRLASLLGLKIVVLTVIFMLVRRSCPGILQWVAVLMAAGAAYLINWNGKNAPAKSGAGGMFFVFCTLVFYSLADICETAMVRSFVDGGMSTLTSALACVAATYTTLGVFSLFGLFRFRITRRQLACGAPYALLWLGSQFALFGCFALLLPVFGNVILASRGLFAVLLGMILAAVGVKGLDAEISRRQWLLRGIAALLMIAAIGLYSFSVR